MRDPERDITMRFLNTLTCYPFNATLADLAGEMICRYRSQGITLDKPDAMIAVTAIYHDLVLLTYNTRHFPMPELRLYKEMPDLGSKGI
jgi:predicted nucleic acid-binding protein